LAETYKVAGKGKAERATRAALKRAWFGNGAPDIARL
jgi:hypothetical protein